MIENNVPINKIRPNPYQPESRLNISDDIAEKFGKSILEHGLLQTPVARVTPVTSPPSTNCETYELGDGYIRLSGFKWLVANGHPEFSEMPLDVRELTDQQMADMILEANERRTDLTPIDKARFFKEYTERFKLTQAEFAKQHNMEQGTVANTIRLLDLPEDVQKKIISQEISKTHALKLVALKDWPGLLQELVKKIIATGMSAAALDEEVRQITNRERKSRKPEPPKTPPEKIIKEYEEAEEKNLQEQTGPVSTPEKAQDLPLLSDDKKEKPEPKTEPPKPAPSPAKPAAAAAPAAPPKWKRKMVLEETGTAVKLSLMSEKGWIIKTLPGNLEAVLEQVPGILVEANKQWEEKK